METGRRILRLHFLAVEGMPCDRSDFGQGGWHLVGTDGLDPLIDDGVALFHPHGGIGMKHLRASTTSPGEEAEEVVLADRAGAGRGIGSRLAVRDTADGFVHRNSVVLPTSMPVGFPPFQGLRPCSLLDLPTTMG